MSLIKQRLDELETYIPGKPISEVQKEYGLERVVKLASNEWSYGPFPEAVKAIKENAGFLNQYPDDEAKTLRFALSEKLDVPSANILIGNGSNELIKNIGEAVLLENDEMLYCSPTFALYKKTACMHGAKPVEVPLKNHTYDLEAMLGAITEKTKMLVVCNPNNPTGTIVRQKELDVFVAEASKNDLLILIDEAYNEFVEDKEYPKTMKYIKQGLPVVVLRTFSKIYGLAGLRIGYGVAPQELVVVNQKMKTPFNVNLLAQVAALESLKTPGEVNNRFKINLSSKQQMYKLFDKFGLYHIPSETNFVLVDVKRNSKEVFEELLKIGLIVRTGDIFGRAYENFIRISVGKDDEIELLEEGLKTIF